MDRLRRYFLIRRDPHAIPALDGLRAFAILLVLGRHAVRPFWTPNEPLFPLGGGLDLGVLLINGWIGVDLFFVLSGFLITRHICRKLDGPAGFALPPYIARRALRILPVYLVVLFIAAFGLVPLYEVQEPHLAIRLGYHLLFLQDYLPANIVVAFWSLGVEEKFYLLAPPLLCVLFKLRSSTLRLWLAFGLILLAPLLRLMTEVGGSDVTTYVDWFRTFRSPFHVSIDGLATGTLIGLLFHLKPAWVQRVELPSRLLAAGLAVILLLLCTAPLLDRIERFDRLFLETALALGFGAVLFGLIFRDRPTPWLHGRFLLFYARISYSLYVVHLPLIPGTRWILDHGIGLDLMARPEQALVFIPVYVLASTVAAAVLHFAVEKPFLMLKDAVPDRPARSPTTAAA